MSATFLLYKVLGSCKYYVNNGIEELYSTNYIWLVYTVDSQSENK